MDGEPLLACLPEYLISVNAEGKEAEHDGIAGEVLRKELGKDEECKDDLEHGKNKAEELAQEPIMKEPEDDEERVEKYHNNEEVLIPDSSKNSIVQPEPPYLNICLRWGLARSTVVLVSREASSCIRGWI